MQSLIDLPVAAEQICLQFKKFLIISLIEEEMDVAASQNIFARVTNSVSTFRPDP